MYYYRTQAGAECDLVLVRGHIVKACIEIKFSKVPVISKGFYQSVNDLKCKNKFILCPAEVDYITKEGVRIVNVRTFLLIYLLKI